jgi:hypothetical protein
VTPDEPLELDGDRFSAAEAVATLERILASLGRAPGDGTEDTAAVPQLLAGLETIRRLRDQLGHWEQAGRRTPLPAAESRCPGSRTDR